MSKIKIIVIIEASQITLGFLFVMFFNCFCFDCFKSLRGVTMVEYVCFNCGRTIDSNSMRRKVRCPYCGGRIFYKPRRTVTKVKAR